MLNDKRKDKRHNVLILKEIRRFSNFFQRIFPNNQFAHQV